MAQLPPLSFTLETRRFTLRSLTPADAGDSLGSWTEDALAAEMLNTPQRRWGTAEQAAYFARFEKMPDKRLLGIFPHQESRAIGLYFIQFQPRLGTLVISHLIGDVAWRGKRATGETAEALYEYFFDKLGYAKAKANARIQNRAILWLLLRGGLWKKEARLVGHLREATTGKRADLLVLGLLADDWRATKKG